MTEQEKIHSDNERKENLEASILSASETEEEKKRILQMVKNIIAFFKKFPALKVPFIEYLSGGALNNKEIEKLKSDMSLKVSAIHQLSDQVKDLKDKNQKLTLSNHLLEQKQRNTKLQQDKDRQDLITELKDIQSGLTFDSSSNTAQDQQTVIASQKQQIEELTQQTGRLTQQLAATKTAKRILEAELLSQENQEGYISDLNKQIQELKQQNQRKDREIRDLKNENTRLVKQGLEEAISSRKTQTNIRSQIAGAEKGNTSGAHVDKTA